MSKTLSEI
jgi:hypothetical protein